LPPPSRYDPPPTGARRRRYVEIQTGRAADDVGVAAKAGARIIVWCKLCQHHVEPDPAEMAARFGAGLVSES
jgi:hypothetical protein